MNTLLSVMLALQIEYNIHGLSAKQSLADSVRINAYSHTVTESFNQPARLYRGN